MYVIAAADAPTFDLPGITFTGYAAPSRGSADLCAWQITIEAGHQSDQTHTVDQDEVFLITSGSLRLIPDGPILSAGDCGIVPAGAPIQVVNPDTEPATAHVLIRAGFTAKMADGTVVGTPPWAK